MIELATTITTRELAERARVAAVALRSATAEQKTRAIQAMARGLLTHADRILDANTRDVEAAKAAGMGSAKTDRLTLTEARLRDMAAGLEAVAGLAIRSAQRSPAPTCRPASTSSGSGCRSG